LVAAVLLIALVLFVLFVCLVFFLFFFATLRDTHTRMCGRFSISSLSPDWIGWMSPSSIHLVLRSAARVVNVLHLSANANGRVRELESEEQSRRAQWMRDIQMDMFSVAQQEVSESQATRKFVQGLKTTFLSTQVQFETENIQLVRERLQADRTTQRQWKLVVKNVYHERSLGLDSRVCWKLDPTEGTDRMRIRMKR
jgi:hypothetical protein